MRPIAMALLFLTTGLLAHSTAAAQATAGIGGVVVLENGSPVAGAEVRLVNAATGLHRSRATGADGRFTFSSLPTSGQFEVSAVASGYLKVARQGIVLRSGEEFGVRLVLAPTQLPAIEVNADRASAINRTNGEVSGRLNEMEVRNIPTEARDLTQQLWYLPGVTPATGFFTEAPNISINGANSLYTNYELDGFDNNEQFLGGQKFPVPTGIVQSVSVLKNTYSAEFGRTANGIINVTTRSGTNDPHGEFFYVGRPGPSTIFQAGSPFNGRDLTGNPVKDGFSRNQFGGILSGALEKNRTFFLLDGEFNLENKTQLIRSPLYTGTVPGKNHYSLLTGKLDRAWNDSQRSSARLSAGDVAVDRPGGAIGGGTDMPSSGSFEDRKSLLASFLHTSTWSPGLVQEFRAQYSRFRWNYGRPKPGHESGSQAVVYDSVGSVVAVVGHPGYVFDETENTTQLATTLRADAGAHAFKFGGDLLSSRHSLLGGGNVNGNYSVRIDNATEAALAALGRPIDYSDLPANVKVLGYNVEARTAAFGTTQNMLSLFAEDEFRASPELNLQLGLRWDYDNLTRSGGSGGDLNNLAPRLSFNWQRSPGDVIKGGYGIFYEKLPYSIYSDALQFSSRSPAFLAQLARLFPGRDLSEFTYDGNVTASFSGADAPAFGLGRTAAQVADSVNRLPARELRILNPEGWKSPYTHQLSLGYERQLDDNWSLALDAVGTWGRNLVRLRDLNAPAPYVPAYDTQGNPIPRSSAAADSSRPLGTPAGGARTLTMSESAGSSRYLGLHLQLKRRLADRLGVNFTYTLSSSKNNTDDINFRATDANNYGQEWGPSANDRRHVVGLNTFWEAPAGFLLSLNGLVQSGQPINRVAPRTSAYQNGDFNGDGAQFGDGYTANLDRLPGVPRNGERLPWSSQFDLGLSRSVPFSRGAVELRADVFNLFNTINHSGYANGIVALGSNRVQTGRPGDPIAYKNAGAARQMQFSAGWKF